MGFKKLILLSWITLVVLLITILSACDTEKSSPMSTREDRLFELFLYPVIDSITKGYDIKNQVLVLHNLYPDNVKKTMVGNVISAHEGDKDKHVMLIKDLYKVLDDSVRLSLKEKKLQSYSFYYKPESISENVNFDSSDFFGSINLSRVVFYKDELACFYIALQCGKSCGSGYIVFLDKSQTKWQIEEIIQIWN